MKDNKETINETINEAKNEIQTEATKEVKEFDPKAAAEARKAEMEEMGKKLEQGVKDVFKGENFKAYLDFCAKLPRYSVNNQLLIMMQKPDATMCQSYTGWKDMNRFVKKGEKGIRIMAPAPYKMEKEQDKTDASGKVVMDKDGEPVKEKVEITVNAFKPVSTFDISQTEGEPIPTLGVNELSGKVEGYAVLLEALKQVIPVPIEFEDIKSGAKGYYHLEENRIAVQEGMSEAQTVKTIIHEAAHQALHSKEALEHSEEKKSQNQKETEAESIAYVVCQHYGIDTSEYSFPYVATWSADKEVPELKASLDTIRRTSAELIVKLDEKVQEKTQEVSKEAGMEGPRYDFKSLEAFVANQGEDVPIANQVGEPTVTIEPPVDLSELKKEKELSVTNEQAETKEPKKAPEKAEAKKPEKEAKETSTKKTSVKDKLKSEKAKTEKQKKPKKAVDKKLQQAI